MPRRDDAAFRTANGKFEAIRDAPGAIDKKGRLIRRQNGRRGLLEEREPPVEMVGAR